MQNISIKDTNISIFLKTRHHRPVVALNFLVLDTQCSSKKLFNQASTFLKEERNRQVKISFVIGINQTNHIHELKTAMHHHPRNQERAINLSILLLS
ncbi:hypothetical protein PFMG_04159 [Plasmodium falciparum IGH-CR14]|uniref:Uncharacterized protein n=2 Tax=Plasmodium falciparum TaxID=5833 RepID=A0A0L0CV46_PLAFA|nr:hypothetical protein PFLG_01480 [Plasmodium falciparum RAJ116]KNG78104.1 hypothetical protein PFMG_04159 [Plasmodium falciparum IGH-CR14]